MLLDVVLQAQTGNENAMLELINRFYKLLVKYAKQLTYEREAAISDLQLHFISAIYKMPADSLREMNGQDSAMEAIIVAYLNKSVRNSYIALSKRSQLTANKEMCWGDLSEEQQYKVEADNAEYQPESYFGEYLNSNALTDQQRELLYTVFYLQVPVADIARRQGVTRQSVNQAKKRALDALRAVI